jgi:hypothetical protein
MPCALPHRARSTPVPFLQSPSHLPRDMVLACKAFFSRIYPCFPRFMYTFESHTTQPWTGIFLLVTTKEARPVWCICSPCAAAEFLYPFTSCLASLAF